GEVIGVVRHEVVQSRGDHLLERRRCRAPLALLHLRLTEQRRRRAPGGATHVGAAVRLRQGRARVGQIPLDLPPYLGGAGRGRTSGGRRWRTRASGRRCRCSPRRYRRRSPPRRLGPAFARTCRCSARSGRSGPDSRTPPTLRLTTATQGVSRVSWLSSREGHSRRSSPKVIVRGLG